MKGTADAELVVDVTLSDPASGSFAKIVAGSAQGQDTGYYDTTSHLRGETEGAGGNIGFTDGHVKWRHFKETETRYGGNGMPQHWW